MGIPTITAGMSVQTMPVIYLNLWSVLISLLNLLLLFLIFKKFLFKPVKEILQKRKDAVEKDLCDAAAAKADAEQSKLLYAEKLKEAHSEAEGIVRTATEKANRRSDEILAEAGAEASAMKKNAEAEIAQERKKALNEVKGEITEISLQIAEKMVGRDMRDADQEKIVGAFLSDLENGGDPD